MGGLLKQILFLLFLAILCLNAEAQTNANIAGPENVLVVYNSLDQTSIDVKNYYQSVRNIPSVNLCHLDYLSPHDITLNGNTHSVILAEGDNIIRDSYNHSIGTWYATEHAWKYFYQYMALPIQNWIISHNLSGTIRYIVLCKGVPFKIQAGADSGSVICNLSVDGLLCMLNSNNYEDLIHSIYTQFRSYAIDGSHYYYSSQMQISNPYYYADMYLYINNRFTSGVFTRSWNDYTIKLDYLISHLDGISYDMVKNMIDRSCQAIHADNYDWFIDADPTPCHGGSIMADFANSTAYELNSLGFSNYSFDVTEDTITYHNKPIMSYSSNGVHTTKPPNYNEGQTLHPDYIQTQLNFDFAPGAIFNTAESFNANLLSSITRRPGAEMGQIVEFFLEGGTLGVGHAYEPYSAGTVKDYILFPDYQAGYSFIDAAYQGMQYLAWQNVIVGDPLTTIAWGKQTLTSDLTLSGTNLVTGQIIVPTGKTLTITNNAVINFRNNGSLEVDGTLHILPGASLNFISGSSLVINGALNAESNITIPAGASLTINNAGTYLSFANGVTLTLNGTLNAYSNVTIPSGVNFNINQGANLLFNPGVSLIINGTLSAVSSSTPIVFNKNSSSNWGTITFNGSSASNSVLDNIEMYYGTEIRCYNGANVTIQNSLIDHCNQGINIYNSAPTISNNNINEPHTNGIYANASGLYPLIINNIIKKTSNNYQNNQGIWAEYTTRPVIAHNDISGFYWGMYIGSNSLALLWYNPPYSPNNRVTNCLHGIAAGWGGNNIRKFYSRLWRL